MVGPHVVKFNLCGRDLIALDMTLIVLSLSFQDFWTCWESCNWRLLIETSSHSIDSLQASWRPGIYLQWINTSPHQVERVSALQIILKSMVGAKSRRLDMYRPIYTLLRCSEWGDMGTFWGGESHGPLGNSHSSDFHWKMVLLRFQVSTPLNIAICMVTPCPHTPMIRHTKITCAAIRVLFLQLS